MLYFIYIIYVIFITYIYIYVMFAEYVSRPRTFNRKYTGKMTKKKPQGASDDQHSSTQNVKKTAVFDP